MDPVQPRRLSVKVHDDNGEQRNLVMKIKASGVRLAGFPDLLLTNCVTLGELLTLSVSPFLNHRREKIIPSTS